MDRRSFLRSSAYFTVAGASGLLAACGGSDDDAPQGSFTFPLGVASGDPKEGSIVFWTRCLPASGNAPVDLRLEVALDAGFAQIAGIVDLRALPDYDHTVRAKLTRLAPATRYHYRFRVGAPCTAPTAATRACRRCTPSAR